MQRAYHLGDRREFRGFAVEGDAGRNAPAKTIKHDLLQIMPLRGRAERHRHAADELVLRDHLEGDLQGMGFQRHAGLGQAAGLEIVADLDVRLLAAEKAQPWINTSISIEMMEYRCPVILPYHLTQNLSSEIAQ